MLTVILKILFILMSRNVDRICVQNFKQFYVIKSVAKSSTWSCSHLLKTGLYLPHLNQKKQQKLLITAKHVVVKHIRILNCQTPLIRYNITYCCQLQCLLLGLIFVVFNLTLNLLYSFPKKHESFLYMVVTLQSRFCCYSDYF